ncbi:CHAD domain-containing protein [Streptomyces albulus]|nr:CHAD domain-containing protein [Streptomyces noursei]
MLRYVRAQVRAVVELDPAARRDLPDAVHQMRVATRRLRSAFRSYGAVLDRAETDQLGVELKWLAAELGLGRDQEVLAERLTAALAEVPRELRLGPVSARLRTWSVRHRAGPGTACSPPSTAPATSPSWRGCTPCSAPRRCAAPPPALPPGSSPAPSSGLPAAGPPHRGRPRRPAGPARDEALHRARKAAKRTRYAAEAAGPALGRPARKFTRRTKEVQQLLGDHQDSVVARAALRELATQARRAGESGFTFGLLYGREEARAARDERELPALWAEVSRRKHRAALRV